MLLLLLPVQCTLKPHSVLQLNVERNDLLRSEITNKGTIGLKRADHKAASLLQADLPVILRIVVPDSVHRVVIAGLTLPAFRASSNS